MTNIQSECCPACGGETKISKTREIVMYKGSSDVIEHRSHICLECEGDFATAIDARENKRSVVRFRKGIDAVPMGCEIRAMRERAGLTVAQAGEYFGGGPVAFSKYENDDLIPDDAMVNLLKLAIQDESIARRIVRQKGHHVHINIYAVLQEPLAKPTIGAWIGTGTGAGIEQIDMPGKNHRSVGKIIDSEWQIN